MSKRAEQRALEAYPNESFVSEEYADMCRSFFIEGYEQAEKDTIERAIAWLRANAVNYIYNYTDPYPDAPFRVAIGCKCWEDLKEYIEKEQA